ncbi:MAG: PQQ-dependent sugar dehydrogenase [Pirellulales bacterium]
MMLGLNRIATRLLSVLTLTCGLLPCAVLASDPPKYKFDTANRQLWTTGKIFGTPEPPDGWTTENAFPQIKFDEPLAACQIPGSRELCVATRHGQLYHFNIDRPTSAKLLLDLKSVVYGIAFHPDFQNNGQLFVTNFERPSYPIPDGAKLSRFTLDPKQLNVDLNSRCEILSWKSGGHNGGCIRFGPDQMLYISVGDNSGIADQLQTGQDISDLSGSILRIDVNSDPGGSKKYRIPNDNPFVSASDARPEVWAFGLRQVWKFGFDRQSRLWAGDVGQDLWEGLYLIQSGGNYGWSIVEAGIRSDRTAKQVREKYGYR